MIVMFDLSSGWAVTVDHVFDKGYSTPFWLMVKNLSVSKLCMYLYITKQQKRDDM